MPNFSDFIIKGDYDSEIKDIKNKDFTTSDYNKFTNKILDAKITAKNVFNKSVLNEEVKTKEEIKKSATKAELKVEQDKIVTLQTYDLSFFIGKSYFVDDGARFYFIL